VDLAASLKMNACKLSEHRKRQRWHKHLSQMHIHFLRTSNAANLASIDYWEF